MTDQVPAPPQAMLRQSLDELATRLIIGTPGPAGLNPFADSLARIQSDAADAGYESAAVIASEISNRIRAGLDEEAVESTLREGLARLAMAIEPGSAETAAVSPAEQPSSTSNSIANDPELLADFILESREHLVAVEQNILLLETGAGKKESINAAFRGFHTIKGLAGFLELDDIQQVAHEIETILDLARNAQLALSPPIIDVVLQGADFLKAAIAVVDAKLRGETAGPPPPKEILLDRVRSVIRGEADARASWDAAEVPDMPSEPGAPRGEPVSTQPEAPSTLAAPIATPPAAANSSGSPEAFKVKVDALKLDYLMDMVGEMAIAQAMLRHHPLIAGAGDQILDGNLAQVARITAELQRTAMALRLVPISQVFQRAARVLRDLSRKTTKQIEIELSGEDTELDKTIAEELADPLMHMVRNSFDHGIETAEERTLAGKPPTAKVRVSASHQAGYIVVEVSDDGRGLNREKILAKAIQNGLTDPNANLSDTDTWNLIFEPGFSTAEKVTDVSGRGVGMDVVRRQVQKLRGSIEIRSQAGRGTSFFIRLPLTLAIIDGLVIAIGVHRYILPVASVREMIQPKPEMVSTIQGREEMVNVRGRLLPILRLHRRLGVEPRFTSPSDALLVVIESSGETFCLMVDEMLGKQEVIIKSLGAGVRNVPGIAGGAILGDGRVGLILDVPGLRTRSN